MDHLRSGCLDNINIRGYYVYGSGQVLCLLSNGSPKIIRISKHEFSINKRLPFEIFPSASVLKSPTKTLQKIIAMGILRGKIIYKSGAITNQRINISYNNVVKDPVVLRNPLFKKFYERIKQQLSQVLKDKSSFKDESNIKETRQEIKNYLSWTVRKKNFDLDQLRSITDEVIRELSVESVINE